jgi:hypothetical protein
VAERCIAAVYFRNQDFRAFCLTLCFQCVTIFIRSTAESYPRSSGKKHGSGGLGVRRLWNSPRVTTLAGDDYEVRGIKADLESKVQVLQGSPPFLTTFWNSPEQLSAALRWLTIPGIMFTAAFGAAIYFVNDRIGALQAAQILNQGKAIKDQKIVVDSQTHTITKQNEQIAHLTGDLESVRRASAELAVRAQNAERGISDSYDFNGVRRQNMGAGRVMLTDGPLINVFQTLIKLNNDKDWNGLRNLCEDQISKTPGWLTPYLFSGVAYANLGDFPKAKERLEFVVAKAGNDTHYSDASRLLAQIKSATQH